MTFHIRKTLACALAAATLASAAPAMAGKDRRDSGPHRPPVAIALAPEAHADRAGTVIAGLLERLDLDQAHREPAWRNPHGHSRPSPDRTYFPPAPPSVPAPG